MLKNFVDLILQLFDYFYFSLPRGDRNTPHRFSQVFLKNRENCYPYKKKLQKIVVFVKKALQCVWTITTLFAVSDVVCEGL